MTRDANPVEEAVAAVTKQPLPRGFGWYMSGFGGMGGAILAVGAWVNNSMAEAAKPGREAAVAVAQVVTRLEVLGTQFNTMTNDVREIRLTLIPAIDWTAERERIEKIVRSMVKEEALKK